jgi:hypothetical protein
MHAWEATEMTRNLAIQLATTVLCICTVVSSARAHHSHGMFYDPCKSLTLQGRIERIEWKAPHILLDLKLDDGTTFHAEWISLQAVTTRRSAGLAQEALTFGARVVVTGYLLRDAAEIRISYPEYKEDTRGPNLVDVAQIRRADNSWSWQLDSLPICKSKFIR